METDYLVVGAGAMGMAFIDAPVDHADVRVALVDRRHTASGHWQDAYPYVQLHQASLFYGVASTVLGTGAIRSSRGSHRAGLGRSGRLRRRVGVTVLAGPLAEQPGTLLVDVDLAALAMFLLTVEARPTPHAG